MTKLLTLGILFSTAVRAVVVAKLVIIGISLLTSFILVIRVVPVSVLALYPYFQKTSFFNTSLSLLKATGTGTNYFIFFTFQIA